MSLKLIRGTRDIFGEENNHFNYIIELSRKISKRYMYEEINTPIVEFTEVYERTLGELSDVVSKEMYTFKDRSGNSLTLRPEGTAGIARAYVTGKLKDKLPIRFFYQGPMFRYERPQKGRYRQFNQIGVEFLGVRDHTADVEVIALGHHILKELKLEKKVKLNINSLGDIESREVYKENLIQYLSKYKNDLSNESQERFHRNPLRILDTKDQNDKKILENAPIFSDFLNTASKEFFYKTCSGLDTLGVPFELNPKLVRGFDYYSHTAFEFITNELGSQNAVIAGGRYDGLINLMGGDSTTGVGWAGGLERLSLLAPKVERLERPIALLSISSNSIEVTNKLASDLRYQGLIVSVFSGVNLSKGIKKANKIKSKFVIIIGDYEIENNIFPIKNLDNSEQKKIKYENIGFFLKDMKND